jgi:ketosteroid isomerase-like protein
MTAVVFSACTPAENKPANANTNANTAKPVAAAPTADALMALDRQANEAWIKGDTKFFEGFLSDKFVSYDSGHRMSKAEMLSMMGKFKCDVKDWKLEDPQMAKIDVDTYVMSYKGTFDGTCTGSDGKSMKLPSPIRAASIYVRSGEKWLGAFHSETPIIDPKSPPPAEKKDADKKDDAKADDKAKSEDKAKTEDKAKSEDKAKPDDKAMASNSNTAAPPKATPSANTDALVKLHTAGWEAFKAKDAKKFNEMLTADVAVVGPMGTWMSGRDKIVKHWTEEMKCEGITTVKVSDGFATALSPTVELLTLKGTADGTCDGMKNGDLYQTAVYVKEGDAWKLAFMFEAPPMAN